MDAGASRRALAVEADLTLAGPGRPVRLVGRGDRLTASVDDLASTRALASALRGLGRAAAPVAAVPAGLGPALERARLVLEIERRGHAVARLGAGTRPTWTGRLLGRWLGVEDLEVRLGSLVRSLTAPARTASTDAAPPP